MILLTAAGGKTGQAVVRALAARGVGMRALLRRQEHVPVLQALGATEVVVGDLRDREALARALDGVSAVYHICPAVQPDEAEIGIGLIAAARAAGVELFIYHSVLHPQIAALTHHAQKMRVEAELIPSGLPYTILQPASYMQNVLESWGRIVELGSFATLYGLDARMSVVDLDDVAEVAVRVLTEPGHLTASYELCGPQALTAAEMAATLSDALHCPVSAEIFPLDQWAQGARAAGLGDFQVATLRTMFHYYAGHGFAGNSNILGYLLRRPPTTFAEFVERTLRQRT